MLSMVNATQIAGHAGTSDRILLGWVTLAEPVDRVNNSYETAAWSDTVRVPAGRYEVWTGGYWYSIRYEGVIVSKSTPSLWAGSPIAGAKSPQGKDHPDVGKVERAWARSYLYTLRPDQIAGFELAPGIRWDVERLESSVSPGTFYEYARWFREETVTA